MTNTLRYLLLVAMIMITGCSEKKDTLHIFIWSQYLDPNIVSDFEKQFNCRVVLDYHEDSDSMIAKINIQ